MTYSSDAVRARPNLMIRSTVFERLKKTVMVWVAVYPSVLVVLSVLGDLPRDWPLPLRVLGTTALIVPIVANITEPAVRAAAAALERGCGVVHHLVSSRRDRGNG